MKKIIDITCLLLASILLSVVCLSAAPAAPSGGASGLRVALLLEDAAPDQGWNDLLRQGLEQARKELGVRTAVVVAPPRGGNGLSQEAIFQAAARQADLQDSVNTDVVLNLLHLHGAGVVQQHDDLAAVGRLGSDGGIDEVALVVGQA